MQEAVSNSAPPGQLLIVATPIGNLDDITLRAIQVLQAADLILAEDTRHSRTLLNYHGISRPLKACHEHNEASLLKFVMAQLDAGKNLALISDAGTPLISDPGYVLVHTLREQGYRVSPVPGASSVIAALSVAGLPTDDWRFLGFLPAKQVARQKKFAALAKEPATWVFFESSHRIRASLEDLLLQVGDERPVAVARELTKRFETVLQGRAVDVVSAIREDPDQSRGEFVVVVGGDPQNDARDNNEIDQLLMVLLSELPLKQSVKLAAEILSEKKNRVYERAIVIKDA